MNDTAINNAIAVNVFIFFKMIRHFFLDYLYSSTNDFLLSVEGAHQVFFLKRKEYYLPSTSLQISHVHEKD